MASNSNNDHRLCHELDLRNSLVKINDLYKAEVIHRRSWHNREQVELATLQWVHWFNHQRLLEPIGYIPPAEAEANYYRQLASQASKVAA